VESVSSSIYGEWFRGSALKGLYSCKIKDSYGSPPQSYVPRIQEQEAMAMGIRQQEALGARKGPQDQGR
jgi:hypothetical protein